MTDDLIKRLLDWSEHDEGKINDARQKAADRIEQLVNERDEALNQLDSREHTVDVLKKRLTDRTTKLAKAVGVLRGLMAAFNSVGNFTANHVRICTVAVKASIFLSELEEKE